MNFDAIWQYPDEWSGLTQRKHSSARLGYRLAVFSKDELYRYLLRITWDPLKAPYMVAGLNPSTATETTNDPTMGRLIGFGKEYGFGGLIMTNLSAFRATQPKDMLKQDDPVGKYNTIHALATLARYAGGKIVLAWGINGPKLGDWPGQLIAGLQSEGIELFCFGQNDDGTPKHPLYLPGVTKLMQFNCKVP